ncbi:PAS domain-containing protein, partial [bacterium]|nr:PAS domain-containing protein [bacterium]
MSSLGFTKDQFESIISKSDDIVLKCNADWDILFANKTACNSFMTEDMLGSNLSVYIMGKHPQDISNTDINIITFKRSDNKSFDAYMHVYPLKDAQNKSVYFCVIKDLTKILFNNFLSGQVQILNSFLDNLLGLFFMHDVEGKIVSLNEEAKKFVNKERPINLNIKDYVEKEHLVVFKNALENIFKTGVTNQTFKLNLVNSEKKVLPFFGNS